MTALLVFMSLQWLFVQPMRQITGAVVRCHKTRPMARVL
jgi:hypothetical protein